MDSSSPNVTLEKQKRASRLYRDTLRRRSRRFLCSLEHCLSLGFLSPHVFAMFLFGISQLFVHGYASKMVWWLWFTARMIKSTLWVDEFTFASFQLRPAVDAALPVVYRSHLICASLSICHRWRLFNVSILIDHWNENTRFSGGKQEEF